MASSRPAISENIPGYFSNWLPDTKKTLALGHISFRNSLIAFFIVGEFSVGLPLTEYVSPVLEVTRFIVILRHVITDITSFKNLISSSLKWKAARAFASLISSA